MRSNVKTIKLTTRLSLIPAVQGFLRDCTMFELAVLTDDIIKRRVE